MKHLETAWNRAMKYLANGWNSCEKHIETEQWNTLKHHETEKRSTVKRHEAKQWNNLKHLWTAWIIMKHVETPWTKKSIINNCIRILLLGKMLWIFNVNLGWRHPHLHTNRDFAVLHSMTLNDVYYVGNRK